MLTMIKNQYYSNDFSRVLSSTRNFQAHRCLLFEQKRKTNSIEKRPWWDTLEGKVSLTEKWCRRAHTTKVLDKVYEELNSPFSPRNICLSIRLCQVLVAACGIWFPDQGLNPGPTHWELRHSHWTIREAPSLISFLTQRILNLWASDLFHSPLL